MRSQCKDYFCGLWCLLYLVNRTKEFSHEQSCECTELYRTIKTYYPYTHKLLEDVKT